MKIIALLVFAVLLFGCAQQAQPQPQPAPVQEQKKNATFEKSVFDGFFASFNYPSTMAWKKNLKGYDKGKGYGGAYFQDKDSNIAFVYLYTGNISGINETDPYVIASQNLVSEATAETDPVGVLNYATSMGQVQTMKVDGGYAAGLKFEADINSTHVYGVAMDIYAPIIPALYSVRVYSQDADRADAIAAELLGSLRFYNNTRVI
jgi:opacity protein-like surface antigen